MPAASAVRARRSMPPPRAASSPSLSRWRARWRATASMSIASAPARPTPAVPRPARADARSLDPGDPVPPHRPARGDRRSRDVLLEPPLGLHQRSGVECQRRPDNGGLSDDRPIRRISAKPPRLIVVLLRNLSDPPTRSTTMPRLFPGCLAAILMIAASAALAQPRGAGPEQKVRDSQQYEQLLCTNAAFRNKRIPQA